MSNGKPMIVTRPQAQGALRYLSYSQKRQVLEGTRLMPAPFKKQGKYPGKRARLSD